MQIRGTPAAAAGHRHRKGIRLTGFYDTDHYFADAKRERIIGNLTFENPYVNAGFE